MRRFKIGAALLAVLGLGAACGGGGGHHLPSDLLVFVADGRLAGTNEIFVAAPPFDAPTVVSGPLVPGASSSSPKWSPGKKTLGFLSNRADPTQSDLWLVDPFGGKPENVTATLDASVQSGFEWSPDCERIAFFAMRQVPALTYGLYVVTIATGDVVEVSTGDIKDGQAIFFRWRPGSVGAKAQLAYRSDEEVAFRRDLYVVNADGTGHARVNARDASVIASAGASAFAWSPDGSHLAYTYDPVASFFFRLFVATGGVSQQVSGITTADREVEAWRWLPDSTRLVFTADLAINDVVDLFVVPASGGAPTPLTTLAAPAYVSQIDLSPDGLRVAYNVAHPPAGASNYELRVVSTAGGGDLQVHPHSTFDPRWSPGSDRIAFVADAFPPGSPDESLRLWIAVPGVSDVESTVGAPLDPEFDVSPAFEWSPNEARIVCSIGVPDPADVQGIYTSTKTGGAPVRLSAPFTEKAGLGTGGGSWSDSSGYVAFVVQDANPNDGGPLRVVAADASVVFDPLDNLQPTTQARSFLWR